MISSIKHAIAVDIASIFQLYDEHRTYIITQRFSHRSHSTSPNIKVKALDFLILTMLGFPDGWKQRVGDLG